MIPLNKTPTVETVQLSKVYIDPNVQQPLIEKRVTDILGRGFDISLANGGTISRRANGRMVWLDGQHRGEAAKRTGVGELIAFVYDGLTTAEEAYLFTYLNKRAKPQACVTFKRRAQAGEKVPADIASILGHYGWSIPDKSQRAKGMFSAVAKAESIYTNSGLFDIATPGKLMFSRSIAVITSAWGLDAGGVRSEIVGGLALFIGRYVFQTLDQDRVIKVLSAETPDTFHNDATAAHKSLKNQLDEDFAYTVHRLYNTRLTKNALGPFVFKNH